MAGDCRVARQDWPGRGNVRLLLAHATSFTKETWEPLIEELRSAEVVSPITAWDAPGHGDSAVLPGPFDWWDTARVALEVAESQSEPIANLGIGHSMGGASLVMAELLRPGTFSALVLIEPIIFPPPYQRIEDNPLAVGALRRRGSFGSLDEALANFTSKSAFARWDARAMRSYVAGGLRERDGRWWLKCEPQQEADVYRAGTAHGAYDRLGEIECPVLVLTGELSHTHPEAFGEHLAERFRRGRLQVVPEAGHFLPMERPDLVAGEIAPIVQQLNAR